MKKIIKIAGFVALALAVLLAGLALAVRLYFTSERVKGIVEKQVAEKLQRQVKLGEISVGLFSGLTITDFSLSEYPDFSNGTFIASQRFQLVPQLLPLLRKKIFIDELSLIHPQVNIIRHADGKTYNFSNLTSPPPTSAEGSAAEEKSPSPLAFLVSKVSIESGRLSFVDQSPAASSIDINELNLHVRNVSLVAPVEARTDFKVKFRGIDLVVDFEGTVWALKQSAKIKELHLKSGTSSLNVTGEVTEAMGKNPLFDIQVFLEPLDSSLLEALGALPSSVHLKDPLSGTFTVKGSMTSVDTTFKLMMGLLNLEGQGTINSPLDPKRKMVLKLQTNECPVQTLLAFVPPDSLPKEVKLNGKTQLSLKLNGTMETGEMDVHMEGKNMDVAYSTDFKKQAGLPLSVGIQGKYGLPLALNMQAISFNLASMQMTGSGTYKSVGEKSKYVFDLKTNIFPLEDFVPLVTALQGYALTGKSSTQMKVTSASTGPDVKGTAQLRDVFLSTSGVKVNNITSTIDYTMDDASGKLAADKITHEYFTGSNLDLKWNLTDVRDMAKMAGSAHMKLGKGDFQNIQKLTADSKMARILFMPVTLLQRFDKVAAAIKLPSFNQVAYKEMRGDYTFKSGVMNVKKFDLDANDLTADMNGTIGLVGNQPLNLDSVVKVAAGLIGGTVGDLLKDDQGRATLKMKITGTLMEPQVKVDTGDIQKKGMEVIQEKYGDDIKQGVDKLLKGLFKK
ncbi:MAG: hypothetical protein KCHDKBKB_02330 [Elusimicrobia bacterium]|nr:hypothetical protein [Elusimicrobiota bacterium]